MNDSFLLGGLLHTRFGRRLSSFVEMENALPPSVALLPMGIS